MNGTIKTALRKLFPIPTCMGRLSANCSNSQCSSSSTGYSSYEILFGFPMHLGVHLENRGGYVDWNPEWLKNLAEVRADFAKALEHANAASREPKIITLSQKIELW